MQENLNPAIGDCNAIVKILLSMKFDAPSTPAAVDPSPAVDKIDQITPVAGVVKISSTVYSIWPEADACEELEPAVNLIVAGPPAIQSRLTARDVVAPVETVTVIGLLGILVVKPFQCLGQVCSSSQRRI